MKKGPMCIFRLIFSSFNFLEDKSNKACNFEALNVNLLFLQHLEFAGMLKYYVRKALDFNIKFKHFLQAT